MVVPFSPEPCANISSCREKRNAKPVIAVSQGGLGHVWRHSWPSGTPETRKCCICEVSFHSVYRGEHSLVCVLAE